jgi:hypothetical protein
MPDQVSVFVLRQDELQRGGKSRLETDRDPPPEIGGR